MNGATTAAARSLTPFGAIVEGDVRFNARRLVPYALMVVFAANAFLWWFAGPAPARGWATNSDVFIVGMCVVFSFMTLPFFTALVMGDPVIRDFEVGVDPLIFSKPVTRLAYLLGKFLGNFAVLVCCQACFALTLALLQAVDLPGTLVVAPRALPYARHFAVLVVLSSLPLATLAFTVGTLTRSVKLVYATTVAAYVLYGVWQVRVLAALPPAWRVVLDPLLIRWSDQTRRALSADALNRYTFPYGADVVANRALVLLASALCFAVLYWRFSASVANPARAGGTRLFAPGSPRATHAARPFVAARPRAVFGARERLVQFGALLGVELRALGAERSLVVVLPLAVVFSLIDVAYLGRATSAAYASTAAQPLLLALVALAIVYVGEAVARDRTLRVEPLLWAAPVPNAAPLLAKLAAVLLLSLATCALVTLGAMTLQLTRGVPVDARPYALVLSIVVLPTIPLLLAASLAAHVVARDKHTAYAACVTVAGALYLLFTRGHHGWLYNPTLYRLWTYADLAGAAPARSPLLTQRAYVLALAGLFASLAHVAYARRPRGRAAVAALAGSAALAVAFGARLASTM